MMHYWQEVLKVIGITSRNLSSRIKNSQKTRTKDDYLKLQFWKGLDHIVKYSVDNMSMKEACPEW